jgi:hypothetical protein
VDNAGEIEIKTRELIVINLLYLMREMSNIKKVKMTSHPLTVEMFQKLGRLKTTPPSFIRKALAQDRSRFHEFPQSV